MFITIYFIYLLAVGITEPEASLIDSFDRLVIVTPVSEVKSAEFGVNDSIWNVKLVKSVVASNESAVNITIYEI